MGISTPATATTWESSPVTSHSQTMLRYIAATVLLASVTAGARVRRDEGYGAPEPDTYGAPAETYGAPDTSYSAPSYSSPPTSPSLPSGGRERPLRTPERPTWWRRCWIRPHHGPAGLRDGPQQVQQVHEAVRLRQELSQVEVWKPFLNLLNI